MRLLYTCYLVLFTLTCAYQSSLAQPLSSPESTQKVREVSLVTPRQLARHNLPSTQRSPIHISLSTKVLSYYTPDTGPYLFLGIGGPMLSYNRLRWRTFTLWVNSDIGAQFESALGLSVYRLPKGLLSDMEVVLGFHVGTQGLPNIYEYDEGSWDERYTSIDGTYTGFQLALYGDHLWVELSLDMSQVTYEEWSNDIYETETQTTSFGLNVGFAL